MSYQPIYILLQDPQLRVIADPVTTWTDLDCTVKHNEVGGGSFTAPATGALMDAVTTPGTRVSVIRNNEVLVSGPIEKPGAYSWSADGGSGPGEVTVNFADNTVYLAWRLAYPNPAEHATGQSVDFYARSQVAAETIMRDLADRNAGPGAIDYRRIPKLAVGSTAGKGIAVNVSTRFEPLTDVLRSVALLGGQLGYDVVEVGGQLWFQTYAPRDLTKQVRFSRALGNLRSLTTDPEAPTGTVAIAGGTGTGTSRLIVEKTDPGAGSWGRIEKWVSDSSGGTDAALMVQVAEQALKENAYKVGLSAVAVDTEFARFGADYRLGDTVAVELVPGHALADVVSSVHITATPAEGELVQATIGTDIAHNDTLTLNLIREIQRRVGRLERS